MINLKTEYVKLFGANLVIDPPKLDIPKDAPLVIDIEDNEENCFVGIGLTWNGQDIYYYSNPQILNQIAKHPIIGHNIKYDLHQLRRWKIPMTSEQIAGDTMIMSYVMDTTADTHGLKPLAKKWLNMEWCGYEDLINSESAAFLAHKDIQENYFHLKANKLTLPEIKKTQDSDMLKVWNKYKKNRCTLDYHNVDVVANYCGSDVLATWRLHQLFSNKMTKEQTKIYSTLELPTLRCIFDMEQRGIKIDQQNLYMLESMLTNQLTSLKVKINQYFGKEVNPKSPKQLAPMLEKVGFQLPQTAKGSKSVAKGVLEQYAGNSIIDLLLDHSAVEKLLTTYIKGFQKIPTLPMIYPTFNQIRYDEKSKEWEGISTNRLSCKNPNMQQIPKKDKERAKLIRSMFIPTEGKRFCVGDYSQIEYRILAHMSQDPTLIGAFNSGQDLHEAVAQAIDSSREAAKGVNYATVYGAQAKKIAQLIKQSIPQAQELLKKHEDKFPKVYCWKEQQLFQAKRAGGITTLLGRFIPIPELQSENLWDRRSAERRAINYIIQGSAAEIIKLAMIQCKEAGYQPILQVHDELIFEVEPKRAEHDLTVIKSLMESVVKLDVPLTVDIHLGKNWNEAKG